MSQGPSSQDGFRQYLPDLDTPRFRRMQQQDAHEYGRDFLEGRQPYWLFALYEHWRGLFREPFKGVTSDGEVRRGLFELADEGVEAEAIAGAGRAVLAAADEGGTAEQRAALRRHHVDSPEWRSWSNPEMLVSDKGVRLDEVGAALRDAVLALVRASMSPAGYDKARAAMRINGFLGSRHVVGAPRVMNEFSYNFVLFGDPNPLRPWGWALYGHHLCLNVFLYRGQMVASPCFTGAEPNVIDEGPHAGTRILHEEEALGLRLMQGLPPELRGEARVYELMHDPAMPPGRWNRDDQRHLCGAYRDNRVVPYEGTVVAGMPPELQETVWAIAAQYLLYLPERSRNMKLERLREFAGETYFCWIGGFGDHDPFYYRIQSPLIIMEFDHHSGVFLTNEQPAKFHIHTILRTPNAGDYGMALRPLIPAPEDTFIAVL